MACDGFYCHYGLSFLHILTKTLLTLLQFMLLADQAIYRRLQLVLA